MNPQVLIVGAGPVGLTLATELTRYGVPVRIVEKAAQRTDKSKALVLWSRTLELLERAGSSEAFVAAGLKGVGANIIAGDKLLGHVDLTDINSPYPYALMLPQSETERILEEHLNSLGVTVEREIALASFTETTDCIEAVLQKGENSETVQSDWLVGCDGAHSTVRHILNLPFDGDTLKSDWILADVHLSGVKTPPNELALYWHEDGVLVFFPITPGRWRIIADMGLSQGDLPTDLSLEQVQTIIDQRGPGGIVASDPIWLSPFRINERKVNNYRQGRVFVAGDAAHIHSPAGGQGMNTGMQDAFNLAWKLALVCRGTCPAQPLLDSYSPERSAVGDHVLKAAGRMTAVAVLKNHTAQNIRNHLGGFFFGLSPVRHLMANTLSETSIGYPDSPLNGPGIHGHDWPAPGQRLPPVVGEIPIGAGEKPLFALFAPASEDVNVLVEKYPDLLEPAVRSSPKDSLCLVRPDGYVAMVAHSGNTTAIVNYLDSLTNNTSPPK